ncbi:D-galactose-binding periplasmic protein [Firmicutes bacterium ASF500]|nr:D-galactose-binding periplasmic protein [Firmicutes bacterium ASF500]
MRLKIKSFSFRSPLSLALLLVLLLPACAGGQEEDDSLRIGVTLYDQDDTFISSMSQNLEQLVQEEESRIGQKITLFISDSRHNQTTQMDHVDRFLARGCDVLCVNMVDRTGAAVIVDKAAAEGVPVIFFNRQPVDEDIQRWEKSFYVGASAQESGTLEGRLVAEAWTSELERWDGNGDGILQYVMLEGEPGHQDALLRTEYTIQTITDQGIEVERLARDTANWNRAQAAARIASWLDEFGDQIEVVLSNNDDMALGAIDALKETGRPLKDWPLIVGIDATAPALEAVEAGQLYGTVFNDSRGQAQAILDLAMALCHGEDPAGAVELVDGHYVWLPYQLVTRENLALFQQGGG